MHRVSRVAPALCARTELFLVGRRSTIDMFTLFRRSIRPSDLGRRSLSRRMHLLWKPFTPFSPRSIYDLRAQITFDLLYLASTLEQNIVRMDENFLDSYFIIITIPLYFNFRLISFAFNETENVWLTDIWLIFIERTVLLLFYSFIYSLKL